MIHLVSAVIFSNIINMQIKKCLMLGMTVKKNVQVTPFYVAMYINT